MFFAKSDKNNNYIEYDGITFEIVRRNVRYFRVEFKNKIPRMILPYGSKPEKILVDNFPRIRKKYEGLLLLVENAERLDFIKREEKEFETLVDSFINLYSIELKVKVSSVKYRKMRRMWGNCRSTGVITLNSRLSMLPEKIISYIVYHEMLHLSERGGHTVKFRKRMKEKFADQKKIEELLKTYFVKFDFEDVNLKNSL